MKAEDDGGGGRKIQRTILLLKIVDDPTLDLVTFLGTYFIIVKLH